MNEAIEELRSMRQFENKSGEGLSPDHQESDLKMRDSPMSSKTLSHL